MTAALEGEPFGVCALAVEWQRQCDGGDQRDCGVKDGKVLAGAWAPQADGKLL